MSDLRPNGVKLKLGKNEYELRFTINAIDDIQEYFDMEISKITDLFKDRKKQMKNLRYLLTLLINENIDCKNDENEEKIPHVEERYIGRQIDTTNVSKCIEAIYGAFSAHSPEPKEEDEEDPNVTSGQQKN